MQDQIAEAAVRAATEGAPAKVFDLGENFAVDFGTGRNPFDGSTFTVWTEITAGRNE